MLGAARYTDTNGLQMSDILTRIVECLELNVWFRNTSLKIMDFKFSFHAVRSQISFLTFLIKLSH